MSDNNIDRIVEEIKDTRHKADRLLADLEGSSNTQESSREEEAEASDSKNIYRSAPTSNQSSGLSSRIKTDSPSNQTGLFIGGVVVLGLIVLVGVVSSINTQVANTGNSRSEYDSQTSGPIPYGKARYKSGRTGKTEMIGVTLSKRTNTNGHITYDAQWADGYKSSYVFWSYGRAEIFSKNGAGDIERTNARYRRNSNGDCVITADTGAVTTFPRFDPVTN